VRVRPLDPLADAGKGYLPAARPLAWAADWRYLPVSSGEVQALLWWYPVGFQQRETGYRLVMPARSPSGQPALINGTTGKFVGRRLPLALRAYPFRLMAAAGPGDTVLGIVKDAEAQFAPGSPRPLFDADGAPTAVYTRILAALRSYRRRRRLDQELVDRLADEGLLTPWPLAMGSEDATEALSDFYQIDAQALNALPATVLGELCANGGGQLIYGHLFSRARAGAPARLTARIDQIQDQFAALGALEDDDEEIQFGF